jgi:pantothenate kinase
MPITTLPKLAAHLSSAPPGRQLIAIAGAPGSGKSTQADALAQRIGDRAQVVPMDGFHFDDGLLEARGHRARKGAPHTFDVAGLEHLLHRLRDGEPDVAIPRFDRDIEISRAGAAIVPSAAELILVEGNYLLLDQSPWDRLGPLFDQTVFLDVPEAVLRARLSERWVGLGLTGEALTAKLEENDLPNAQLVLSQSRTADWTIENF